MSRGSTPALEVEGLDVPFGEAPGLRDVTLRVERGDLVALVGASGSGKTSLLRAIAGSGAVADGCVWVEGREVRGLPPERRGVVLLAQTPLLFPHLTVFENVAFPLRVRRIPRDEIGRRVRDVLEAVRLGGLGDRMPATLSGGQGRRVALARSVVARPPVLLLDEPLSALDPSLREEVRGSIVALQEEYAPGTLLVTHDLREAGRLADRIGVLIDGRLAQLDTPTGLFRRPATPAVARFLGLSNELEGRLVGGRLAVGGRDVGVSPRDLPDGPVLLLFGPEGVHLSDGDDDPPGGAGAGIGGAGRDGLRGVVVGVRHRPGGAEAVVELEGEGGARSGGVRAAGRIRLEVEVDPSDPPERGRPVGLHLRPGRLHLFPDLVQS